jgi:hypothetical protein
MTYGGIDMTKQMVGGARQLVSVRAGGQNAKITIALHSVGVDDLAVNAAGKRNGKLCLSARRRSVDENSRTHIV